jgi:hypothetical protein
VLCSCDKPNEQTANKQNNTNQQTKD